MHTIPDPILRSSRLKLRRLCPLDYAPLYALANDTAVTQYLHEGAPPSLDDVQGRVARAAAQWEHRGYGMMAVEDDSGFVGRMGIFHPAGTPEPLLVYALCQSAWGKGYATEALPLILEWMHAAHGIEQLSGHIDPRNTASARIALKLGATRQGTVERAGAMLDLWLFRPTVQPFL